jgi:hypothetical protein
VDEHKDPKRSWAERRRENKRLKQERTGDSPAKAAQRRGPQPDVIDKTLKLGGIDRPSRFPPEGR